MGPAVILRPAEEIKLRHRHRQIGFLGEAFEQALEDSAANVGVHLDPSGGGKYFFHFVLRADDEEVDHVAGIAGFVGDAAGNLGKERVVHARDGLNLAGDDTSTGSSFIDFDANGVSARARIIGSLIDADPEAAIDRGCNFLFWAPERLQRFPRTYPFQLQISTAPCTIRQVEVCLADPYPGPETEFVASPRHRTQRPSLHGARSNIRHCPHRSRPALPAREPGSVLNAGILAGRIGWPPGPRYRGPCGLRHRAGPH